MFSFSISIITICILEYSIVLANLPGSDTSGPCADQTACRHGMCENYNNRPLCHCKLRRISGDQCDRLCFGSTCSPCSSNPCYGGGQCQNINNNNDFKCVCTNGSRKKDCKTVGSRSSFPPFQTTNNNNNNNNAITTCYPNPCLNGGVCRSYNSGNQLIIQCSCANGFVGVNCERRQQQTNPTFPSLTPSRYPNTQYPNTQYPNTRYPNTRYPNTQNPNTRYPPTLTTAFGTTASFSQNPCLSMPCQNGGLCNGFFFNYKSNYVCSCPPNFHGLNCEQRGSGRVGDLCDTEPCENGGRCLSQNNIRTCICPPTFTGRSCEQMVSVTQQPSPTTSPTLPPNSRTTSKSGSQTSIYLLPTKCDGSVCQNGGTCYDVAKDSTYCHCLRGFYGIRCENDLSRR
ncbi:hypothetical protein SNEBB_005783 [Seison nebaliae]|nr:hypothetical protein SNEBB_005783 [Seison nebaliae]